MSLTIYGDGLQTRSFYYVNDLIASFIKFMQTSEELTGPINIGNPFEMTIKDLAKLIIELTNSKSTLIYQDFPQDGPIRRKPDISLAKKELEWSPIVEIEKGLLKSINYFKGNI